jgi:uncharacterized lipoprotein YddW (UPF0748 family)
MRPVALALLGICLPLPAQERTAVEPVPPPPREKRAAWVASVSNIDWPSAPGLPVEKQRKELSAIIARAHDLRLNTLVLQIRPAGDALYASEMEPWSPFLTGKMGQAPEPLWDPLAFAIEECHRRGMELHAWFNPYRALFGSKFEPSETHILRRHPERAMKYGTYHWMDPGLPEVRAHTLAVMLDVTRRYDVDGIHIDDYFYPYPAKDSSGKLMPFPDDSSYQRYRDGGGALERGDWRRENVNTLVREIHQGVKAVKPRVKFGISPFGLWRPNVPEGTGGGLDPYEDLSADSLKWLREGWLDYMVPQLYWPIEPPKLSFTTYLDWWHEQNTRGVHIWPGMAVDRVGKDRGPAEILRQISAVRERAAATPPGHFHWNFGSLSRNTQKVADLVVERAYQTRAIPPPSPWISDTNLPAPVIRRTAERQIEWKFDDERWSSQCRWWTVQIKTKNGWELWQVLPVQTAASELPKNCEAAAIRAADHGWEVSTAAVIAF